MTKSLVIRFLLVVVLSVFLSRHSIAAIVWDLDFHGFDKEGKILAFTVHEREPECDPQVSSYFVNTTSNSWAINPLHLNIVTLTKSKHLENAFKKLDKPKAEDFAYAHFDELSNQLIDLELAKQGIQKGNVGDHAVSRRPAEIVPFPHRAVFVIGNYDFEQSGYGLGTPFPFSIQEAKQMTKNISAFFNTEPFWRISPYDVQLSTFPGGLRFSEIELAAFKLTITNLQTGNIKILQEDTICPKPRGLVYGYAIKDIYVYRDVIAVFLAKEIQIFEGSGVDYMVVTGILPK